MTNLAVLFLFGLFTLFNFSSVNSLSINRNNVNNWAPLKESKHAELTTSPIKQIMEELTKSPPNPSKTVIRLYLGDSTLGGILLPSNASIQAIIEAVKSHKYDGYQPSNGLLEARQAISSHFSTPEAKIDSDDVILTSGDSHALDLAIGAIANEGQNILVPRQQLPLYSAICSSNGVESRKYESNVEGDGLIDLKHLESLIDKNTRAIIITNPSPPFNVIYPREHLVNVLELALKHKIVIISDEINHELNYHGFKSYPLASLSPQVPIITIDSLSKSYHVPGWRLGWAIIYNRFNVLTEIKHGMMALNQKIDGPSSLVQGALSKILQNTPQSFFDHTKDVYSRNAKIAYDILSKAPGLKPFKPQGAMYIIFKIDDKMHGDEMKFIHGLIKEESVYCLPGTALGVPNFIRLVLIYPEEVIKEACERIASYAKRNRK